MKAKLDSKDIERVVFNAMLINNLIANELTNCKWEVVRLLFSLFSHTFFAFAGISYTDIYNILQN